MDDYLIRAIATKNRVRAIACVTTNLVNEGVARHSAKTAVRQVFGEALTGMALMGSMLKMRQRMAVKFQGDGPMQKIIVEGDNNGFVRGYTAVPQVDLPLNDGQIELYDAFGEAGVIIVVKDLRLDELYEGVVPVVSGNMSENLTTYFNQSEQVETLVVTSVALDAEGEIMGAGGVLFQALPGYEGDLIAQLAERLQELPPIGAMAHSGKTPEDLLTAVFADTEHRVLMDKPLEFQCSCSYERTTQALVALGRDEIQAILDTDGEAVVDCHFCHEQYVIESDILQELLEQIDSV